MHLCPICCLLVPLVLRQGLFCASDLVCIELDRAHGKTYRAHVWVECTPVLRTLQNYLFVMSTADLHKPREEREFFRFIMPYERRGSGILQSRYSTL